MNGVSGWNRRYRGEEGTPGTVAGARDFGWQTTQFIAKNGRISCDNFVTFPYLTDVYPGDGGLIVKLESAPKV